MIDIDPFQPADLGTLTVRAEQVPELLSADAEAVAAAGELGPAFTVRQDGRTVACAGLIVRHAGYASGWALFAEGIGIAGWAALLGAMRRVLDACSYRRVDISVRTEFAAAHRFAERLGFEAEAVQRCIGADGSDFTIYSRIR
jgi:RimJ/RimL family protein N-acetyltransferase